MIHVKCKALFLRDVSKIVVCCTRSRLQLHQTGGGGGGGYSTCNCPHEPGYIIKAQAHKMLDVGTYPGADSEIFYQVCGGGGGGG